MSAEGLAEAILSKLGKVKGPDAKGNYTALCPFHEDHNASFSFHPERGFKCFSCSAQGSVEALARRLGLGMDGYEKDGHAPGVSLRTLAQARGLDPAFLRSLGWRDAPDPWYGRPALAIPYRDAGGQEVRIRWRMALEKPKKGKDNRFAWGPGDTILPYGLDRLQEARKQGYLVLVEGETDAAALWQKGIPALGIPGAGAWKSEWAAYQDGIAITYAWQEPDKAGTEFVGFIAKDLPHVRVTKAPPEAEDPAELAHLLGDAFPARLREILDQAQNLTSHDLSLLKRSEVAGTLPRVNAEELRKEALRPDRPRLQFLPLLGKEGLVVQGFSHLISGYPKVGKTELLTRLALAWSRQQGVLYFTEEPKLAWEERLGRLPSGWEAVNLVFALGSPPEAVRHTIAEGKETVVIVDTLRLLGLEDENDNSLINRALTPLIALCRGKAQTLVLAHHTRKMGGEFGTAAAGGHALVGVVDIVLEVLRDGQATRRRKVRGWGRIVEVPELLYELRDGDLVALGEPEEVELEEVKGRLRDALGDDWQKTEEFRKALGDPAPSKSQVAKALSEMVRAGEVERDPPIADGTKQGKTYRWRNFTSHGIEEAIRSEVARQPVGVTPVEDRLEV